MRRVRSTLQAGLAGLAAAQDVAPPSSGTEPDRIGWSELEARLGALPRSPEGTRVGGAPKTLANECWRSLGQGCRNVADAQGAELTCQAAQGEGDQIGQPSVAENLAIEGFDALLPSPRTDANPVPAMEAAEAAGIPVLDVDDAVIPQARHCVGDVQRDSGVRVAQWLIDRHLEGGKAAVIEGQAGAHAAGQRTAGFTKTAEGAGFEVVAGVAADRSRELACNARPSGGVPRGRQGRRRGRAPRRGDPGELAQRAHAGGRAGLLPAPRHRHHCRDVDRPGGPGEAR